MYQKIKRSFVIFAAISAIAFTKGAAASDEGEFAVQAGIEYFRWQEFDDNGRRLLKEYGPLLTVGGTWNNFRRSDPGNLYNLNGRIYLGEVNYDGQACNLSGNCVPAYTKTDYFGVQGDAWAGYHFGDQFGFDLLGGIGFDDWVRAIQSTATASGGTEIYTILYTKLGAGFSSNSESSAYRFHAGIKYPFYTHEHSDGVDNGVDLSPGKKASGFARFDAEFGAKNKEHFGLTVFYDSYRFSKSPRKSATINGIQVLVWQPESHMDVVGAQVAYYFF